MDESVTEEGRRTSILKIRHRIPLQEVQSFFPDDDTVTTTLTRSRRVSFGRNVVKEFLKGSAVSTQALHEYEQSSESLSEPSDCSGPLDLAMNRTVAEPPPSPALEPIEADQDARARRFTENCINIAKSVFQDKETELTAIIIGAKPTLGDEDKKNSSCMSFTTLDMSHMDETGHRSHVEFMPMRHPEMLSHHDPHHPIDKSRFEFLDHSLGLSSGAKLPVQATRTPLAPLSQLSHWEDENEENIRPAHTNYYTATPGGRGVLSEKTMEFTCTDLRNNRIMQQSFTRELSFNTTQSDMEETCGKALFNSEKSMNASRFLNTSAEDESDLDDPLGLDAPRDDFLSDLSNLDQSGVANLDDSDETLAKFQKELANLSSGNLSFREQVKTLPGLLKSKHTPIPDDDMLETPAKFQRPIAEKSMANESMEMTEAGRKGKTMLVEEEMEITEARPLLHNTSDPLALDHPLEPMENSMFLPDESMTKNDAQFSQKSKISDGKAGVPDDVDMEFTHCNAGRIINIPLEEENEIETDSVLAQPLELAMETDGTLIQPLENSFIRELQEQKENDVEMAISEPLDSEKITSTVNTEIEEVEAADDIVSNDDINENRSKNVLQTPVVEKDINSTRTNDIANENEIEALSTEGNFIADSAPETSPAVPESAIAVPENLQNANIEHNNVTMEVEVSINSEKISDVQNEVRVVEDCQTISKFTDEILENVSIPDKLEENLVIAMEDYTELKKMSDTKMVENFAEETSAVPVDAAKEPEIIANVENDKLEEENATMEIKTAGSEETLDIPQVMEDFVAKPTENPTQEPDSVFDAENAVEFEPINMTTEEVDIVENVANITNDTGDKGLEVTKNDSEIKNLVHDCELESLTVEAETNHEEPNSQNNIVNFGEDEDKCLEEAQDLHSMEGVNASYEIDTHLSTGTAEVREELLTDSPCEKEVESVNEPLQHVNQADEILKNENFQSEEPTQEILVQNVSQLAQYSEIADMTLEAPKEQTVTAGRLTLVMDDATDMCMEISKLAERTQHGSPAGSKTLDAPELTMEFSVLSKSISNGMDITHCVPGKPDFTFNCSAAVEGEEDEEEAINQVPGEIDVTVPASTEVNEPAPSQTSKLPNFTIESPQLSLPLYTPVAGLAALSTKPPLRDLLQAAPLNSTTNSTCLERTAGIEDALRSLEVTENMGGLVPRIMKTMSDEQHMRAIHESTRIMHSPVTENLTFNVVRDPAIEGEEASKSPCKDQTQHTYTVAASDLTHNVGPASRVTGSVEKTYLVTSKRVHSESPCPGENLKKIRPSDSPWPIDKTCTMDEVVPVMNRSDCPSSRQKNIEENTYKRVHSDSPFPSEQSKKTRESSTPRSAKSLSFGNESYFGPKKAQTDLDVSLSFDDITLSTEESPMFDNQEQDISGVDLLNEQSDNDASTNENESAQEVTSTTHHDEPAMSLSFNETASSPEIVRNLSIRTPANTSSHTSDMRTDYIEENGQDTPEKALNKIKREIEQQSKKPNCIWKLIGFEEGKLIIQMPLLEVTILLTISININELELNVTGVEIQQQQPEKYQNREKVLINEFGCNAFKSFVQNEKAKIKILVDVPLYLDFFNSFAQRLTATMADALTVLRGCYSAKFSGQVLSIILCQYAPLTNCNVNMDLMDLLTLGRPGLTFTHDMGRLDEKPIRTLMNEVQSPILQNFVRSAINHTMDKEKKTGFVTKRPPLLF